MSDASFRVNLILGGDKTGNDRFYVEAIHRAELLWKEYLAESERED